MEFRPAFLFALVALLTLHPPDTDQDGMPDVSEWRLNMGHIDSKGIFRKLGRKIDHLPMRAPWNEAFYQILKELYSEKEADVVVKMPYGLSDLHRIARVTKYESAK